MTADWAMVALTFIGLVITVLGGIVVHLFNALKETKKDLNDHKLHTANHYAKDVDINRKIDELSQHLSKQMNQNFEHLKELIKSNT